MHVYINYGLGLAKKVVKSTYDILWESHASLQVKIYSNGALKSLELVLAEPRGVLIVDYDRRLWVSGGHHDVFFMSK